ncbi:hypothetical protein [Rhodococcus sp. 06-235-1A]|uniref:hypothetical protein n=1 Tax=Rhodococcus sp. 06-235-1A TaxID=2022508 RepID=UPI00117AC818|nr:hypothetical protein [Rhodococcus sp. 06-235-1A]
MTKVDEVPTGLGDVSGTHIELVLSYLRSIPDPVQRIRECAAAAERVRGVQKHVATIRRHAVYEATLRPGANGESVAAELGVSPKAVSQATVTYRRQELAYLKSVAQEYFRYPVGEVMKREIGVAVKGRDVVQLARVIVRSHEEWHSWDSLAEKTWRFLDEGEQRARQILSVAGVESVLPDHRPSRLSGPNAVSPDSERRADRVDTFYDWPIRVLNALPGITALGGRREFDVAGEWMLSWQILPALPHTTVFETGPHRDGWAITEWLVWFNRDLARAGKGITSTVTSPPPYLNQPGESLSFQTFGSTKPGSLTPTEWARMLTETWDDGTGYMKITWPA